MKPNNLRELLLRMTAENGGAHNRLATIGQVFAIAEMVLQELETIKSASLEKEV